MAPIHSGPLNEENFHSPHFLGGWRFRTMVLTVLVSIIGYFLFTLWAGWHNVLDSVAQVGVWGILLSLFLSLVNYGLRFLRWQLFLKNLGHTVAWKSSLRIYMSGFSLTTTPGKSGEALRGVFLKEYGVPFRKSFGAFLAERFCDLMSVSILALGGLWLYPQARPILLLVALVVGFALYAVQKDRWMNGVIAFFKKILPNRFIKAIDFIHEMIFAFRSCFTPRVLSAAIALGVAAWLAEALALCALLNLAGYPLNFVLAIFIYGFSLVIGGITLLPGGLGGAEVTMFQLLLLNNVPASAAVAITLVVRLTTLWFSVFIGLIVLPKKQILWNRANS
jgi:glycosyltransferase 2 family protein